MTHFMIPLIPIDMTRNDKIFVSIANYRDPEIQPTIKDLFDKAEFPGRVNVGVISQVEDSDVLCVAPKHPRVRETIVHRSKSKGVCWARSHVLTQLRQDEYYTLQIDSHTRFVKGWDVKLQSMLESLGSKAVITHYPCGYTPPNNLEAPAYLRLAVQAVNGSKIPVISSVSSSITDAPTRPEKTAFYSGNMSFTYSSAYDQVPYDPNLYFLGEEITMAVRLFTHGYDLYTPNEYILWHRFNAEYVDPRPIHWKENDYHEMENISRARIRHLLGIEVCKNFNYLKDIHKYGLGVERSLKLYQTFAGLYFKTSTIESRCRTGKFE